MIAGLVISVGISLLRAFLDKKMRYNEEMTMIGDIPILLAIPKFDEVNKSNKKKGKRESVRKSIQKEASHTAKKPDGFFVISRFSYLEESRLR